MTDTFNKSDKQKIFAEHKGTISELNDGEKFCSVTITTGHENKREVNFCCKKHQFDEFTKNVQIGDRVLIRYFLSSRKKERWYTMANILEVCKL